MSDDQSYSPTVRLIKYLLNPAESNLSRRGIVNSSSPAYNEAWQELGIKLLDDKYCIEWVLTYPYLPFKFTYSTRQICA